MSASLDVKETIQAYWDRRPCNVRHSSKPVGTREYFNEAETRRYFVQPHIPRFADFQQWAGKRVLEIGCGIGTDTMNFARAGARVTAVDLSPVSLEIARQRAQVLGLEDKITFHLADAETLHRVVPPEPYDLVYSFGVLHHTPHPEQALAHIREHYVHPKSLLKIMVYHRVSYKVLWILLRHGQGRFWRLRELIAQHSEAQPGCPLTRTYTRRSVRKLLTGFQIFSLEVDYIFPWSVPEYIHHRYKKVWYFQALPPAAFRWLERHFGWHLCVTAQPDEIA